MHRIFVRVAGVLLLGVGAASLTGCAGTGLLNWKKDAIPKAGPDNPAVQITAIWQPAEGVGLDGLPARGFAGQILFFSRGRQGPVQVDGDVRIYLFDDAGTPDEQAKPIHQFDFQGEAWTAHLQDSMLGPAYYVFIPYVRKGPYQAQCALRVRLKSADGPTIYSEMVRVTLPGPMPDTGRTRDVAPAPGPDLQPPDVAGVGTIQAAAEGRDGQLTTRADAESEMTLAERAAEERLQRLEQKLQQMVQSRDLAADGPGRQEDAVEPGRRFRLTPAHPAPGRDEDGSPTGAELPRGTHPLDDHRGDGRSAGTQPQTGRRHPLEEAR